MHALRPSSVATLAVVFSTIVFAASTTALMLFPDRAAPLLALWLHGIDLASAQPVASYRPMLEQLFFGLFCLVGVSFVLGLLFAAIYNLFPRVRDIKTLTSRKETHETA